MQISNIKASRIPNRVWLTFSDKSFIPFFIDDVVKLSLTKNQEIDESKFELIIQTALQFTGREYALRQIAISPKTEKIINQKLKLFFRNLTLKYKINTNNLNLNEINQQTIQYLKDKKLLNDQDFIDYFIKKNKKKSRQQIIYSLQQLGVNQELLSSISFNQESDVDKIKKIILKKKNIDKLKLKASLYRRGFNLSDINRAFDDWVNFR